MNIALGALPSFLFLLLFNRQYHLHIHNLVEVPGNPVQLVRDIRSQCRRYFEVVTADRQVHVKPPVLTGFETAAPHGAAGGKKRIGSGVSWSEVFLFDVNSLCAPPPQKAMLFGMCDCSKMQPRQ